MLINNVNAHENLKMKTVLPFIIVLIGFHVSFGQVHDEGARPSDPVKTAQVYPNPAIDFVNIKFETPIAKTVRLAFHSIIGNSIELDQEVIDEFEIRIKVKDLPIGYYLVAVHDPQTSTRGIYKFLKK